MARSMQAPGKAGSGGFSLLELMIAIAVVGIVTAAAVTSYGNSTMKARRGAAKACLMEAAQFMERNYTLNMTYDVAYPELACAGELEDFYQFAFQGVPDGDSYEVEATPIGVQLDDTQCGALSIDQAGVKDANNIDVCW